MVRHPHNESPLTLQLKPSRRSRQLIALLHGLAIVAAMSNALPLVLKGVIAAAVLWQGYRSLCYRGQGLQRIEYSHQSGWQIELTGQTLAAAEILPTSVITSFLVFLHVRLNGKSHYLPVFYDALTPIQFRQLIICLKLYTRRSS